MLGVARILLALCYMGSAVSTDSQPIDPGVTFRLYEVRRPLDRIPRLIDHQTPNADFKVRTLSLPTSGLDQVKENAYFTLTGFITSTQSDVHEFRLTSNRPARLVIGGKTALRTVSSSVPPLLILLTHFSARPLRSVILSSSTRLALPPN